MSGLPSDELNFDLLGSLGVLSRNRITPALQPEQGSMESLLHAGMSQDNMTLGLDMANIDPSLGGTGVRSNEPDGSTLHDAVNRATLTLRGRHDEVPRSVTHRFPKLYSDDDLVRIISSYPRIMVQPGNYPPFVHHELYRCSTGDVPEPLAKAFCCIGAFYSSVPTSKNYVYTLLNEESGALVKEFMTRRLIQEYVRSNITGDSEEVNWRKWIVNETIRRTLFLANTINTLSCKTQRQDAYYFEPLDDNLIRNMTLPAPDSLWNASSRDEWLLAKAQLNTNNGPRSRPTVQQVLTRISSDGQGGAGSSGGVWGISFDEFDEFTKLIISTIRSPLAEE
ncbi:unnamed protein product [Parascedosporium putredinis]|uniref:Transcription factor domain-containing protein n=1 Tax=Parascedosporium putredinis TaxID=1442378 RepID=A0A9P1H3T7_9PEZI|nr:unnamed protein product [Parascedosporium putredinis]CAI7995090.1 unnamed protein product [Parascedosporium putredinis]